VPPDASVTREKLLDAALREFAQHGIQKASLIEITRQAGQRNRGALHYHFGSREGVLCAVLDRHAPFLVEKEREVLERAVLLPGLAPLMEAVVRPAVELAESGWRGRCCLKILCELTEVHPRDRSSELAAAVARTGGDAVFAFLMERLPPMPDDVREMRLTLVTEFILRSVGVRSRRLEDDERPVVLDRETFIAELMAMATAALEAPVQVPLST